MKLKTLIATVAVALGAGAAGAQDYPERPITLVVPFGPGGSTDTGGRLLASKMSDVLGQPVLVENRPGATGSIGTDYALRAKADGYTLIIGNSDSLAANAVNFPDLSYDPAKDMQPITLLYRNNLALAVTDDFPAQTFEDFIAYAKANPGSLVYGTSGVKSAFHFLGETLNKAAGIDMLHVPYKGGGPAVADLVAGQIPVAFGSLASLTPFAEDGSIRIIALTGEDRHPDFPDIPVIREYYPGVVGLGWGAIGAPAGTPDDVVAKLNAAAIAALKTDEVVELYKASGLTMAGTEPGVVTEMIVKDIAARQQAAKDGIVLE